MDWKFVIQYYFTNKGKKYSHDLLNNSINEKCISIFSRIQIWKKWKIYKYIQ